jgi:predicted permease
LDNVILSVNVVIPLFLMMALGYFLKQIRIVDKHSLNVMNSISFKVFLPLALFQNIYSADLSQTLNAKLILFAVVCITAMFLFLMFFIPKIEKENSKRGVMVQATMRSNFILFGLPVSMSLCGSENIGPVSLLSAIVIPLFNIFSVIALERFRGEGDKIDYWRTLKGIATNPLIIASILGVLLAASNVKLPFAVNNTISDLAKIGTPFALVVLGGTFDFRKIQGHTRQLLIGLSGKLVIVPAFFLTLGVLAGFRNVELVALLSLFSSPVAVSSYVMAQQMGGDADLASEYIVLGAAFSIATMFAFIFILKSLQYI